MVKKNVIDLAKGSTDKKKTSTKRKTTAKKKPTSTRKTSTKKNEPTLTPEQERDLKAKAKVEELLETSSINNLTKKDDIIELDETKNEPKGIEWLEEQLTLLSEKNKELTTKMEEVKIDFEKVLKENQELKSGGGSGDGDVKKAVISLFNELQENHIKLGVDKNGIGNFRIYCPGFLNRMIKFFPFLNEIKRYN